MKKNLFAFLSLFALTPVFNQPAWAEAEFTSSDAIVAAIASPAVEAMLSDRPDLELVQALGQVLTYSLADNSPKTFEVSLSYGPSKDRATCTATALVSIEHEVSFVDGPNRTYLMTSISSPLNCTE